MPPAEVNSSQLELVGEIVVGVDNEVLTVDLRKGFQVFGERPFG
jgi:hypothetical protein